MSDEDNKHDTSYINKHKYTNHDTRKLHLWARHVERAVFVVHLLMSCHTHLMAQDVLESSSHPHAIHERLSLTSPSSLSTSTWPSPSSSTSPSWCTLSRTPTSTTWTPCNTTCAPPRRGVTTPTTSPSPSQDHIADEMLLEFAESGHPIFRATTPQSRGILKSKGHGKLSIHCTANEHTI